MKNLEAILEPAITYKSIDDSKVHDIISSIRKGMNYKTFQNLIDSEEFSLGEWATMLNLSKRTLFRYKADERTFSKVQSERIIHLHLLNKYGIEVFGNKEKYFNWLESENIALRKKNPIEYLDSVFGIMLIKDELTRIEHGVLA